MGYNLIINGEKKGYIPVNWHTNGKWTRIEDVFPMAKWDIPASYVSLQGIIHLFLLASWEILGLLTPIYRGTTQLGGHINHGY